MTKPTLLIVDDETIICQSLQTLFEKKGYQVFTAGDGESGMALFKGKKGKAFKPDVVLLDVQLPDANGMKLLEEIGRLCPTAAILMITGFGSIPQSVEALHKGAADYVVKPFNIEELTLRVERSLKNKSLEQQVGFLSDKVYGDWESKYVLGPNPKMKKIYDSLTVVAESPSTTVFIHGETGTGKEVIANRIHFLSDRNNKPFVEVNATALTAELLESELFGHEEGAFTGASSQKKGLFEIASGGTLFLDEIGDMDLTMQAKLLRALQERTIRRVGGTENIEVDIRLITATNRDLAEAVANKEFREDLYYRLTVVPIDIPPLRERPDDIEILVSHFIRQYNKEFRKEVKSIAPEALQAMMRYPWPGNVRELKNVIERTILLECQTDIIELEDLVFTQSPFKEHQRAPTSSEEGIIGQGLPLEMVERKHIEGVLLLTSGNKNKAAQILGIDRTTLYNKLKKYEIKN